LRLPAGGDANTDTRVAGFGARVTLVLFPQLIVNPAVGGDYPVVARFTTVDPDTNGPDDGAGTRPDTTQAALMVHIDGPMLVPFTALRIDTFAFKDPPARGSDYASQRDGFSAAGQYVVNRAGNGVNWRLDAVTISFASFSQTIPATAFVGNAKVREYRGEGPGVRRMRLWGDGRFELNVGELHLLIPDGRQIFALRIGDDLGATIIKLRSLKRAKDDP
jgi:hypothetical protein